MVKGFGGFDDAVSDVEVSVKGRLADVPVSREVQGQNGAFNRIHWPLEDVETVTEDHFIQKKEKWSVDQPHDTRVNGLYYEAIFPTALAVGVDLSKVEDLLGLVGKTLTFEKKRVERQRLKRGKDGKRVPAGTYQRTKRELNELGEWVDVLDETGEKIKETASYEGLILVKVE